MSHKNKVSTKRITCPGERCGKTFDVVFRCGPNVPHKVFHERHIAVLREHLNAEWDPCRDPDRLRYFLESEADGSRRNTRNNPERR